MDGIYSNIFSIPAGGMRSVKEHASQMTGHDK